MPFVCRDNFGEGDWYRLGVTVSAVVGSAGMFFTFDAPFASFTHTALSMVKRDNAALSGGISVTLVGVNFGSEIEQEYLPGIQTDYTVADRTATATVAGTFCVTTSWQALTSLACVIGSYHSTEKFSTVRTGFAIGTSSMSFSFDSPAVTFPASSTNMPNSVGSTLSVTGVNFAPADRSAGMPIQPANHAVEFRMQRSNMSGRFGPLPLHSAAVL